MKSEQTNAALEILNDKIGDLMNQFSVETNEVRSKELSEKIDVLQKIKQQVYLGNREITEKVIFKKEEGIL